MLGCVRYTESQLGISIPSSNICTLHNIFIQVSSYWNLFKYSILLDFMVSYVIWLIFKLKSKYILSVFKIFTKAIDSSIVFR